MYLHMWSVHKARKNQCFLYVSICIDDLLITRYIQCKMSVNNLGRPSLSKKAVFVSFLW